MSRHKVVDRSLLKAHIPAFESDGGGERHSVEAPIGQDGGGERHSVEAPIGQDGQRQRLVGGPHRRCLQMTILGRQHVAVTDSLSVAQCHDFDLPSPSPVSQNVVTSRAPARPRPHAATRFARQRGNGRRSAGWGGSVHAPDFKKCLSEAPQSQRLARLQQGALLGEPQTLRAG